MKKKWIGIPLALALALTSCGKPAKQEPIDKIRIGVTVYDQYDAFITQLIGVLDSEVENKEKEWGITVAVDHRNASGSQLTQNDQVEELIRDGCNVILVNLVDRTDPTAIIDMAKEAEVPVIFFNRELVPEDLKRWSGLYYVGAKANESGIMEGELAADWYRKHPEADKNGDGVIQYVVLEGEAGHQDSIVRTDKVVQTLQDKGVQLERVDTAIANWNRDQARTKTAQLIEQGDHVEFYLCNNDAMALGVIDAYKALGEEYRTILPAVFGIDGLPEALYAVQDGDLAATVYNDKEGQVKALLELSYDLATGSSKEALALEEGKYIRLPYTKVTERNVDEYL